jgi:hypothetical protein
VADLFQTSEEIIDWAEPDLAFTKLSSADNFCLQLILFSEEQAFTDPDLPSGAHQALPFVRFSLQLPGKQDFYLSLKEVARGRIVGAEPLGRQSYPPAIQPGGKDACVIEHQQVPGTKQGGKVPESPVRDRPARLHQMEHSGRRPVCEGLLGNQFFRQIVMKF